MRDFQALWTSGETLCGTLVRQRCPARGVLYLWVLRGARAIAELAAGGHWSWLRSLLPDATGARELERRTWDHECAPW